MMTACKAISDIESDSSNNKICHMVIASTSYSGLKESETRKTTAY